MSNLLKGRVRTFGVGLGALFLAVLVGYVWLGVITEQVDALKNKFDSRTPHPNCLLRGCQDGGAGEDGEPGQNASCGITCTDGTNGADGFDAILQLFLFAENGTQIGSVNLSSDNLSVIIADNDTIVDVPGPTGPQGRNGTDGSNGNVGATGSSGVNGTCISPCVDGANGTNGAAGTNGVVLLTVTEQNGTQVVSFNATFANLAFIVSSSYNFTASAGAAGTPGTNGTNGHNGTNGVDGTNGTNGANGHNGTDGVNGVNSTCPTATTFVTTTYTNTQMKTGATITVIPAAGAGVIIVPLRVYFRMNYGGTNAFTNSPNISVIYASAATVISTIEGNDNPFWRATNTTFASATLLPDTIHGSEGRTVSGAITSFRNTAVQVKLTVNITCNAANNNNLTILMEYYTITF